MAELIFFFCEDSCTEPEYEIHRLEQQYLQSIVLLDLFEENHGIIDIDSNSIICQNTTGLIHSMSQVCKLYGKIEYLYQNNKQQIAQFIRSNHGEVLAILTDDTDFVVFEGINDIWWSKEIDFGRDMVLCMNRDKIVQLLQFSTVQLRLFGALKAENKFLPAEILDSFHEIIMKKYQNENHVENIACFIQSEIDPNASVHNIVGKIFDGKLAIYEQNAIENSLNSYKLEFSIDDKNNLNYIKERLPIAYKMLTDEIFFVSDIGYIDLRFEPFDKFATVLTGLLRKCFGILFSNKENRPKNRKICIKHSHNEPFKIQNEIIDYPRSTYQNNYHITFL